MSDVPQTQVQRNFCPPSYGEWIGCAGNWFQLGNILGQGAFGLVYECRDVWGNELAAKVLLPRNRTYEEVRAEWMKELQVLHTLRHPNITYVHQAFEYRDTFYLIIERCNSTLFNLINTPEINGDLWLPYVARDILHALDFVHRSGYVHKDLHPGNIFIFQHRDRMLPNNDAVWMFKVGDLGISRLETDINHFNTILAQWMVPPEFLDSAEFGPLDRHVDIYHTGLLLLALLTRKVPAFTREEILAGEPRRLAESMSSPFSPVIAKALRRHVEQRTQSAIDFWREILVVVEPSNTSFPAQAEFPRLSNASK